MKKVLIFVLLACMAGTVLFARGSQQAAGSGETLIAFANMDDKIEFCQSVRKGFEEECAKRGWKIVTMDNKFSGTDAIANARNVVSLGAKAFVEFNPDSTVGESIMQIMKQAKIPTIAIDIPLPGAPYFGASNYKAGEIGGVTLAEIAMKEWGNTVDCLVLVTRPDGGELIIERQDGYIAGVRSLYPNLRDNQVFILDGKGDVLPSQEAFTSFLTAHPTFTKILVGGINDQMAQGSLAAAEIANRQNHILMISQGCDTSALNNLYLPVTNAWRGSVSYAPENYGQYCMPTVELMIKGERYPEFTYVEHFTVTKDNVNRIYPKR
jgi:ribose transport system substrate-binding protein